MKVAFGRVVVGLVALLLLALPEPGAAAPEGTLTWGLHVTLAAKWLDPSDTEAFINPFMVLYAVHDALVKPMPAGDKTPSLAESWTVSKDGLTYEFVLRKGVRFHNGDPMTAEDVKFSFDRYRGAGAKLLKDRVREVQVVSFTPGVELVMEAFEGYWRKAPSVKRLVFRSMPDETTRAAALKAGDVDLVYLLSGPTAEEIKRTPGLRLAASKPPGVVFLDLPEQWDPKSPWHDRSTGYGPAR